MNDMVLRYTSFTQIIKYTIIQFQQIYIYIFSYHFQVDRVNLTRLFQGLYFQVEAHQNLKYQELHEVLHRFANNPLHEHADMMILVVLSHGRDGKIVTSGGREFPIESLYEQFNNQMCPLLRGKPKFFIIQVI